MGSKMSVAFANIFIAKVETGEISLAQAKQNRSFGKDS